jgi:hypothetical protein
MTGPTFVNWRHLQQRGLQYFACLLGLALSCALLSFLVLADSQIWLMPGPINTGHETLNCESCHRPAEGNLHSQLRGSLNHLLNMQEEPAAIGHYPVSNTSCLACHQNPLDPHRVYRFLEPRFQPARASIQPQYCVSCHQEHTGKRVTIEATFCVHCHAETRIANDPIDVPHAELFANQRWETCLGCHDFHANHVMDTPSLLENAYEMADIQAYFDGSPLILYSTEFYYEALKELPHDE